MKKSAKEFNVEEVVNDAIIKGRIKIELRKCQCTFCNETKACLKWCPKPLPWVIPVCEQCFLKLHKAFGKIGGGIIWG